MKQDKRYSCENMHMIIDQRYDSFEAELIDEVCTGRPGGPYHHDEYDCEGCEFFKLKGEDKNGNR